MPHSAGCVSFSLLSENPSRWHGNKRSARWRGAGRSFGAGESVYERFITDVTLICHALSRSCSKAHTVNGFFPQTWVCRWLRVADGEKDGEGGLGEKYMVWGDEEEHFMGCITARPLRDLEIFFLCADGHVKFTSGHRHVEHTSKKSLQLKWLSSTDSMRRAWRVLFTHHRMLQGKGKGARAKEQSCGNEHRDKEVIVCWVCWANTPIHSLCVWFDIKKGNERFYCFLFDQMLILSFFPPLKVFHS